MSFDGVPFGLADRIAASAPLGPADLVPSGGHFAAALWDRANRELSILRDPLGTKPLYYWHYGAAVVFASEPKAILAHPVVGRRVDHSGLSLCLTFDYVPAPRSMFERVSSVAPRNQRFIEAPPASQ